MKLRLPDVVRNLVVFLVCFIPLSATAHEPADRAIPTDAASASGTLGEFLSLESVLIVVIVLLVLAVVAHRTRSP